MTPIRRVPGGWAVLVAITLVIGAALFFVALRGPAAPRNLNDRVRNVASTLRCPVCQNLSVADSPSRLAQEMRSTIARELEAGRTPGQIRADFAASYGEWILLAPPKRGIDLIAWLGPLLLLLGVAAVGFVSIRRWTADRASDTSRARNGGAGSPALSLEDRKLLERELHASVEESE